MFQSHQKILLHPENAPLQRRARGLGKCDGPLRECTQTLLHKGTFYKCILIEFVYQIHLLL